MVQRVVEGEQSAAEVHSQEVVLHLQDGFWAAGGQAWETPSAQETSEVVQ